MKSFDQIVDECFKPRKPDDVRYDPCAYFETKWKPEDLLHHLYKYSVYMMKPFYGRDINEPVIKICKRILNKPNRFHLIGTKTEYLKYYNVRVHVRQSYISEFVVQDKDTNQKFVVEENTLKLPTCLTKDENKLLVTTLYEWYSHMKTYEEDKKLKREQKRKDKFRQELTDLYKDL